MATKHDFTPDQWTKVLQSPMLVGIAVSTADPSGLWGTLKEAVASSSALVKANVDEGSSQLISSVVSDIETSEGRSAVQRSLQNVFADAEPAQCVQRALTALEEVSSLLETKTPGDAANFKTWLCGIGRTVAEAAVEGSFLGFGGVRVSDAEQATLSDIARTLRVKTPL
jgi:hypothetical protein